MKGSDDESSYGQTWYGHEPGFLKWGLVESPPLHWRPRGLATSRRMLVHKRSDRLVVAGGGESRVFASSNAPSSLLIVSAPRFPLSIASF